MQLWLVLESKTQLEQHKAKKCVLYKVDGFIKCNKELFVSWQAGM